jgi:hypothetical protein
MRLEFCPKDDGKFKVDTQDSPEYIENNYVRGKVEDVGICAGSDN